MTSLTIEQLGTPASHRDERVVAFARELADAELGGRVLWCYGASSRGAAFAADLARDLEDAAAGGVRTHVPRSPSELESIDAEDLVLLLGASDGEVAARIRDCGAPAVRLVGRAGSRGAVLRALDLEGRPAVDAYLWLRPCPTRRRPRAAWLEALMPVSDVLTVKQVEQQRYVAWARLLAEVACGDRRQTVGGTLHVRPAVAGR